MRLRILGPIVLLSLAIGGAQAAAAAEPAPASAKAHPKTAQGVGVITEIDRPGETLTVKHQPIPAFGWPSMTMPFHVVPPSLMDKLKVGQKITFDTNEGTGLPEITAIRTR
jgi:Cu/Ag efflux protein CusF